MDITYVKTSKANLNNVPIVDGQNIFISDDNSQYVDFNNKRNQIVWQDEMDAVNENGCCNILPNNASGGTSHNVSFTVNSDDSVSFSVDSTPDGNGVLLIANHLHFEKDIRVSGLPNIEGCVAYLYDNTASQYIWINENDQLVTIDSTHDYGFVIAIARDTPAGTTGTYYPMLYDARLKPTGYVPYAMTNRELTDKVASMLPPVTSFAANGVVMFVNASNKWGIFLPLPFIINPSWTFSFSNIQIVYVTILTYYNYVVRSNGVIVIVNEDLSSYVNKEGYAQIAISI